MTSSCSLLAAHTRTCYLLYVLEVLLYRNESSMRLRIRAPQAGTYFVSVCVELESSAPAAASGSKKPNEEASASANALNYRVCKLQVDAPRVHSGRASFPLQRDDSEELGPTRHARAVGFRFEPLCAYVHSTDGSERSRTLYRTYEYKINTRRTSCHHVVSGTAVLKLLWERALDASCKLFCVRGDALVEAPRAAIVCSRAQCAELRVHAPAAGEWGVELYASASGERTQELVWRGVLLADTGSTLSAAVGALDGHQVGPQPALAALPLALDAPLEPMLCATVPEMSIALSVRHEQPVHVQCALRGSDLSGATADERQLERFVFKQSDAQRVSTERVCVEQC